MKRVALIAFLALPSVLSAEPRNVEITGAEDFTLAASLRQSDGSAPAILLLHQCNRDRTMYADLAEKLEAAGFRSLALDFRGFGGSTDDDYDLSKSRDEEAWARIREHFPADVEAAYQFLASQGDGQVVGTVGASCGGTAQIAVAAAHPEVKRLIFFSAGLSQTALRDALQLQAREMMLVTAKGDARAASAAGTIGYRYGKERTELVLYEGESHGYPLYEEHPDLADRMVTFFLEGPK